MKLSVQYEREIKAFGDMLGAISGPDDLFPPEDGVREFAPNNYPMLPPLQQAMGMTAFEGAEVSAVLQLA